MLFSLIIVYLVLVFVFVSIYREQQLEEPVSAAKLQKFGMTTSVENLTQLKIIAKDRAILYKDLKNLDAMTYKAVMEGQHNKILNQIINY